MSERLLRRVTSETDRLRLFNAKWIKDVNGCWVWQGGQNDQGYGTFFDGRTRRAHRWSYEHFRGPIPVSHELDHLCRNRGCVNPQHLEAVPFIENVRRGEAQNVVRSRRGTCDRGHPFVLLQSGRRYCRRCATARNRERMGHAERMPAQCGTPSGYYRHLRRGEKACRRCKDANAANRRRQRAAQMVEA